VIREPIRITEAGILRAQFCDSAGDSIDATNIEVNLYAPGLDPDIDFPTVSGLAPVFLGNGVYQLNFTAIPPGGTWIDQWNGDILGTPTTNNFTFEVIDSGNVYNYPVFGVCNNNLLEITLASGIASLDGVNLDEEYEFFFTTEYDPLYADERKLRLEAGGLLTGVPSHTLCTALLEASIEADCITFVTTHINDKLYQHARREYVACKAAMIVASNVLAGGGILKSKKLGDFAVEYDPLPRSGYCNTE